MKAACRPRRLSFGAMTSPPYRHPASQVKDTSAPGAQGTPILRSCGVGPSATLGCVSASNRTHPGGTTSESCVLAGMSRREADIAAWRGVAGIDAPSNSCLSPKTSAHLKSAAFTGDYIHAPLELQRLCAAALGETSMEKIAPRPKTRSLNHAPGNPSSELADVIRSRYLVPEKVSACMNLVTSHILRSSSHVSAMTKSNISKRRTRTSKQRTKARSRTKRSELTDPIVRHNDLDQSSLPVESDVTEVLRLGHPPVTSPRDPDVSLAESRPVHHSRSLGKLVFPPQTWAAGQTTKTLEAILSDVEMEEGPDEASRRLRRLKGRARVRRVTESQKDDVWRSQGAQKYTANYLTIPDPSNQKLNWTKEPLSVLIIRKHLDESVMIPFRDLVIWLVEIKKMVVFVEQSVMKDSVLKHDVHFKKLRDRLSTFKEGDDLTDKVDFIICLGGDGTLLYVSSLFQRSVPPVMAFNMGSLGFLTPFRFGEDYKTEVSKVMQGSASLLLRYRLKCVVVRHDPVTNEDIPHVKNIQKEDAWTKIHKLVLNEVVVDRGPSSYLCNLELYIENRLVTSVQGDGLIISTPSGSTAYAVAAGASMIHPSVPCILITPICPHSLSFRPIVVPAGVELKVNLSPDARGTAMVSFDGRDRKEIHQGDSLRITTAAFPVPSICAADQIEDWFDGLANCLNWNIRHHQRPLQNASSFTSIDSLESSPDPQNPTNNSADQL